MANSTPGIMAQDVEGRTALMHAAINGNLNAIDVLAKKWPESLKLQDHEGRTALMHAIIGKPNKNDNKINLDAVRCLAEHCPESLLLKDRHGRTALMIAILKPKSDLEAVKMLAEQNPAAIMMYNDWGDTPLMASLRHSDDVEIANFLVDKCPDVVKVKNKYGDTSLHCCRKAPAHFVESLIETWPDALAVQDDEGNTPLMRVILGFGKSEVVALLASKSDDQVLRIRNKFGQTAFLLACQNCDPQTVKYVLERWREAVEVKDNDGWGPLIYAAQHYAYYGVEEDGMAIVRFLVDEATSSSTDNDGNSLTPLMAAARVCNVDIVKLLVQEKGHSVKVKDKNGMTAIMHAAKTGFWDRRSAATAELLSYLNVENKQERLTREEKFQHFSMRRIHELASFLIEQWPESLEMQDKNGQTALMLYCSTSVAALGFVPVSELAVLLGGTSEIVRIRDHDGKNALLHAIEKGHAGIVKILLDEFYEEDAFEPQRDKNGKVALMYACQKQWIDGLADAIWERTRLCDPDLVDTLKLEITTLWSEVFDNLVDKWPQAVQLQDNDGKIALMYAAECGRGEDVKLLVEKWPEGANVRDKEGRTALMYAALGGEESVVKFFYEKNGKNALQVEDNAGRTALMYTAQAQATFTPAVPDQLLEADPLLKAHYDSEQQRVLRVFQFLYEEWPESLTKPDKSGTTSLMYAALNGHQFVVDFILKQWSESLQIKDNNDGTVLMKAAAGPSVRLVKFLVEQWPEAISLKDKTGRTALSYAAEKGQLETVRFLLESFQEAAAWLDEDGNNALMYAAIRDDTEIIELLASHY